MQDDDALSQLARAQSRLVTRQQLKVAGLTAAAIRWRVARAWALVLPNVVATSREPLTRQQRVIAACLEAGPDGVVSGSYACAWHGLTSVRAEGPVLVLVPDHMASRRVGFVQIRRTRRPDHHPFERPPARIASRPRAVIDACRSIDPRDARSLVIEAVQRHLVRLEDLDHELNAGGLRGSRTARLALADARTGAWSVSEADLLGLCHTSTVLPRAWPNPRIITPAGLTLISPDMWLDDIGMAVMVHSRSHHLRELEWEQTVEYDGGLAEYGVIVIGVTPRAIRERPDEVLRRIERTYLAALASGRRRPPLIMEPRGWGVASA